MGRAKHEIQEPARGRPIREACQPCRLGRLSPTTSPDQQGMSWTAFRATCVVCVLAFKAWAASVAHPFYGDPPDEHHPWSVHDGNRPQPPIVAPGTFSSA